MATRSRYTNATIRTYNRGEGWTDLCNIHIPQSNSWFSNRNTIINIFILLFILFTFIITNIFTLTCYIQIEIQYSDNVYSIAQPYLTIFLSKLCFWLVDNNYKPTQIINWVIPEKISQMAKEKENASPNNNSKPARYLLIMLGQWQHSCNVLTLVVISYPNPK